MLRVHRGKVGRGRVCVLGGGTGSRSWEKICFPIGFSELCNLRIGLT